MNVLNPVVMLSISRHTVTRIIFCIAIAYWALTWYPPGYKPSLVNFSREYMLIVSIPLLIIHAMRYTRALKWILFTGFSLTLLAISALSISALEDPFIPNSYFFEVFYINHGVNTSLVALAILLYKRPKPLPEYRIPNKSLALIILKTIPRVLILDYALWMCIPQFNYEVWIMWPLYTLPIFVILFLRVNKNSVVRKIALFFITSPLILFLSYFLFSIVFPETFTLLGDATLSSSGLVFVTGALSFLGLIFIWFVVTFTFIVLFELHYYLNVSIPVKFSIQTPD